MTFSDVFFNYLSIIDNLFWEYIGFIFIVVVGIFLTIKTKGYQFFTLTKLRKNLAEIKNDAKNNNIGTSPLKLYFASIGGMVGLGNIAGIVTAVTIGGPGGIVWMWFASFAGMLIKYCEIYLGIKYRVRNQNNGYDGGPMYYLQAAFGNKILSYIVCILLCIYGVEIYQFTILADTISHQINIEKHYVIATLMLVVIYSAIGGVSRLANLCSRIMPLFLIIYFCMSVWIIYQNGSVLIEMLPIIFKSAFTGHAAVGGFAGSTIAIAAHHGMSKAVYSGDIGIGYDSIVLSETKAQSPTKQARMAIYALFSDTIICSLSCLIVLVTGLWQSTEKIQSSEYIAKALAMYFPYSQYFLLFLILVTALTTIIGYMVVGLKCAKYLNAKIGEKIYLLYAIIVFPIFAYQDQSQVMVIMSISAGLLLICNISGILKLLKKIEFN